MKKKVKELWFWPEEMQPLQITGQCTCVSSTQRREQIQQHAKHKLEHPSTADVPDLQLAHHLLWFTRAPTRRPIDLGEFAFMINPSDT